VILIIASEDDVGTVARLMYASGDVFEPNIDAVEYMEDLVVEFLSDLVSYSYPIDNSGQLT
jgi:hypothetical protein